MKKRLIIELFSIILILAMGLAACGPAATQPAGVDPETFKTLVSGTLTAVAGELALTPIVTDTTEATAEPTATMTLTLEPTKQIITVTVNEVANCRSGPSIFNSVKGTLAAGTSLEVIGVNPTGEWFYVRNSEAAGGNCWVSNVVASVSGPTSGLPIFTPQPTPYPTRTPTKPPTAAFTVGFVGLTTCGGNWGLNFQINNTGNLKLESIRIRNKDQDGVAPANKVIHTSDKFTNFNSGVSQADLTAGESGIVTSCNPGDFTYDPTGHNVNVNVTICTANALAGTCSSQEFMVKP
jgi:hypothetical protein